VQTLGKFDLDDKFIAVNARGEYFYYKPDTSTETLVSECVKAWTVEKKACLAELVTTNGIGLKCLNSMQVFVPENQQYIYLCR
jgi:hypothetical protein